MDSSTPSNRSNERQDRLTSMAELVLKNGSMSVDELTVRYPVSAMTIYRDLAELERLGIITRTHGFVSARATSFTEASASFRKGLNSTIKSALAERAAEEIEAGATIMIDDSTTTLAMVPFLPSRGPLTLITHSQAVAQEATGLSSLNLFVTGGMYRPESESMYGSTTVSNLRTLRADICFMSTTAIVGGELFHPLQANADVKQAMLASSAVSVLLADHSKFGHTATYRVASVAEFDIVIVDEGAPAEEIGIMKEAGTTVISVATGSL
ncbi:DeoR/GlpR family DNA-binding transcription regulator [Flaviflexus massiliensis]|uniref:DeoR/GlpR family DNA-binding transcription regulator n=1 Tax=Flaviflexus massiliensis TaxID=1522309 RepID=UPI00097D1EBF|nr:DeoR/GlpR family DNA-binding transcription regulator [Flaviflexus massiliensis]